MKNGKILKIILISILIITLTIAGVFWYNKSKQLKDSIEFAYDIPKLDSNIYKIETDMQWFTMMNDGGSHTNEYYVFDFETNIVCKAWESNKANLGGTPETSTKIFYEKEMNGKIQADAKKMINNVLKKEDINETNNYHSFVISTADEEKIIYNEDTIKEIKALLKMIDEL